MKKHLLTASKRTEVGKKNRKLKKQGFIAGVIYGRDIESVSVKIGTKDFVSTFKETGMTGLIDLKVEENLYPSLVKHVQLHPVTGSIIHVEFHKVNLKEKISANVPVELVGESPAQKDGVGLVLQTLNEIEVEALPTDLPEKMLVDISKLTEVGQQIVVGDLEKISGVEILTPAEEIIVKVSEAVSEEAKQDAQASADAAEATASEAEGSTEGKTEEAKTEEPKAAE